MVFQPNLTADVFIDFAAFLAEIRRAKLTKVPRYQDVVGSLRASSAVAYKSFYFISHRWDSADDPDPSGWQLEALRQFAVELEANGRLPSCFWYDFSSLPQGTRTRAEEIVFKKGLAGLNALSIGCETIALISGSADPIADFDRQLKRGWILCEMIVAHRSSQWKWWFHQGDKEIFASARTRTERFRPLLDKLCDQCPFTMRRSCWPGFRKKAWSVRTRRTFRTWPTGWSNSVTRSIATRWLCCPHSPRVPFIIFRMKTLRHTSSTRTDVHRFSRDAPSRTRAGMVVDMTWWCNQTRRLPSRRRAWANLVKARGTTYESRICAA